MKLADQSARDAVTQQLDKSIFIEAGAGSGKTTSLVGRIVSLVRSGTPIERIVAITFTEFAATELRHRIKQVLLAEAKDEKDVEVASLLRKSAGKVETGWVSTLHAFALRICKRYPIEAGLLPGFEVMDEVSATLQFDDAWNQFLDQLQSDRDQLDLFKRSKALDIELQKLSDLSHQLDNNWDRLAALDIEEPKLSKLDFSPELRAVIALDQVIVDGDVSGDDKLVIKIEENIELAKRALKLDGYGRLQLAKSFTMKASRTGSAKNWEGMDIGVAREALIDAGTAIHEKVTQHKQELMAAIAYKLAKLSLDKASERLASGHLNFHDLLVSCRALLGEHLGIRRQLASEFDTFMLDEFQDTDPLQIELACLIANPDPDVTDWRKLISSIKPGRLAVVGDPKQSIYRFRRADIGVYSEAKKSFNGTQASLTTNFRSTGTIIDWVNDVFGVLIGDTASQSQPEYEALTPARPAGSKITTFGGPIPDLKADEIRALESVKVASTIATALNEGWEVQDQDTGELRPIQPSDIAVLIPSRISMKPLEDALDAADISYRLQVRSLLFNTEEIETILNVLEAVDSPRSSVAVAAALRSSVFCCSDKDLAEYFIAGGKWDYSRFRDGDELVGPDVVKDALLQLRSWHVSRFETTPAELCEQIISAGQLFPEALARPRARDSWRRYRFLVENAREFRASQGGGLSEYVRWAKMQRSEMARIAEPSGTEVDHEAVQIMTMHGSKGLEFPFVLVAGAPTGLRVRSGQVVLFDEGARSGSTRLEVKKDKEAATEGFQALAAAEEVMHRGERIRLQYVACTRARDYLAVSLFHKEPSEKSKSNPDRLPATIGELLWDVVGTNPSADAPVEPVKATLQQAVKSSDYVKVDKGFLASWEQEKATKTDIIASSKVIRPSSLVDHTKSEGGEPITATVGVPKIVFGTAVHAILEIIDLHASTEKDLNDAIDSVVSDMELPSNVREVLAGYVHSALSSELLKRVRSEKLRYVKEVQVCGMVNGHVAEGIIDLLVLDGDTALIVDYKTDSVSDESELAELGEMYRPQLKMYEQLTVQSLDGMSAKSSILSVSPSESVLVEL